MTEADKLIVAGLIAVAIAVGLALWAAPGGVACGGVASLLVGLYGLFRSDGA